MAHIAEKIGKYKHLENQIIGAIRKQFSRRHVAEDDLLAEIHQIFHPAGRATTGPMGSPAATRTAHASLDEAESGAEDSENSDVEEVADAEEEPAENSDPFDSTQAGRFLAELRPLLLGPQDRGRRLPTKGPDAFDGGYTAFRPRWERLQDYLEINTPSVPTDRIKIQVVGTFMKGAAWTWYETRKRNMVSQHLQDNWKAFRSAMVERFTDRMESRKDWQRMRTLEYKGDIQTYLASLEEINSRVGATGEPLREIIMNAITPEMHRAIYQRYRRVPKNDADLIEAVRETGIIEEEILLSMGHSKTKSEKKEPKKNKDSGEKRNDKEKSQRKWGDRDQRKDGGKKLGKETTDFSSLENIWESPHEALKNVDQTSIDKYKAARTDCIRCGKKGHRTVHCFSKSNADGKELPRAPRGKGKEATASIPKRKRAISPARAASPEDRSDSDAPKPNHPKVAAATKSASALRQGWYMDESGASESDSDF